MCGAVWGWASANSRHEAEGTRLCSVEEERPADLEGWSDGPNTYLVRKSQDSLWRCELELLVAMCWRCAAALVVSCVHAESGAVAIRVYTF